MCENQNIDINIINEKFKFMGFLDHARWCDCNKGKDKNNRNEVSNYYSINMAYKKEAFKENMLLTHFLGYITNRQTPFERIFEQLDYIFSQIVHDFMEEEKCVDDLLPIDIIENNLSYFSKKPKKVSKKESENVADSYAFVSHELDSQESVMPSVTERIKGNNTIFYATSRFYTPDFIAIRLTLDILSDKKYNRSFFSFVEWAIGNKAKENKLERLLYALWILGYRKVGQWIIENNHFKPKNKEGKEYAEILKEKKIVLEDFDKNGLSSKYYKKEFQLGDYSNKNNRYNAKRVACFVRDLLMYHPCANVFEKRFGDKLFGELREQMAAVLELPGDTWNNNDVLNECLHLQCENKNANDTPNIVVRKVYDMLCEKLGGKEKVGCFPEQFDCTFDFAPRMCNSVAQKNCCFCPIDSNNMKKHQNH